AVTISCRRTAIAAGPTDGDERPIAAAGPNPAGIGRAPEGSTGRITADQRRTGRKGAASVPAEQGGGTEEHRNRKSARLTRGKGRSTGTDFEIQVGIPREYVA